ncbi:MAG: hypothetical protein ACLGHJ_06805 [Gammaproteobacteria bacterium]
MSRRLLKLFALLPPLVLAGCMSGMPEVTDAALAGDGTILVGKIRLEPPLAEGEQQFARNIVGEGRLVNGVVLLTSTEETTREPVQPRMSEMKDAISAKLGELFVLKAPPHAFNVTGGMITLEMTTNGADYAFLPGRLQAPIKAGDKAVYVGTLVFHRDDFFEITRVEIRDEFAAAERAYRKQVSGAPALRKALWKKLPR